MISSNTNNVTNITYISLVIATAALVLAYSLNGLWFYAALIVPLGLFWLAGIWRNKQEVNLAGLLVFVGLAAYGAQVQAAALWLLAAIVFSLIAWDLGEFRYHMTQVDASDNSEQLQAAHLKRLGMTSMVGLLAGSVALGLQITLTFGWAVLLGLLMAVSLNRLIRLVRRGQK